MSSTPNEYVFDLSERAGIRHRGEYTSEQTYKKGENKGEQIVDSQRITEILETIDWSNELDVDSLQQIFRQAGLDTDKLHLNWEDLIEEGKELVVVSQDLKANFKEIGDKTKTYLQLVDGLKPGDKLTDEQKEDN